MKNLTLKVKHFIQHNNLFSCGDTVIVGVSGGADSITLASVVHSLQYELGIHLHIAHYNHKIRRGSDADQKFVEQFAQSLNVPYTVEAWKRGGSFPRGSVEELAREKRFDFFVRLAKKEKAQAVALAHTENDQAETVLMRILRGTGLQGVRAILPLRDIHNVNFVRPLLEIKRKDIEQYLTRHKIFFRTDITNKQTKFFRNKIRLELLPLLKKEYNSNVEEVLLNFSANVAIDYEYLDLQAKKSFRRLVKKKSNNQIHFNLKSFVSQHKALRHMIIRHCIELLKGDRNGLTWAHMKEVEDMLQNRPMGSIVHLPQNICAKKAKNLLFLYK